MHFTGNKEVEAKKMPWQEDVMVPFDASKSLWIIDSTLRERSMMKGREYTEAEKLKVANLLAKAGVHEIEAGIPSKGSKESRVIRQIRIENPHTLVTCWAKASIESIELAKRCSANSIHLCFSEDIIGQGVSSAQFESSLNQMGKMIKECFKSFDYVSVGISNPFNGDLIKLNRFVSKAVHHGALRVRLADSGTRMSPEDVQKFFETVKIRTNAPLEFHGHNKSGKAMESSLRAIRGGAESISLTVGGLGENGGVANLEEMGPALLSQFQYTNLNFYKLNEAAKYVNMLENRRKPRNRSVAA